MKILVIDNYDSFTWNLIQLLSQINLCCFQIVKNDEIPVSYAENFDGIIISPGPGIPETSGIIKELICVYSEKKPMLGICLGHQAIAEVFGGKIFPLPEVRHGITVKVKTVNKDLIFEGIPSEFDAGLYHSWAVDRKNFPDCLEILAFSEEAVIMALKHKERCIYGFQFHPESIMTPFGKKMMENWLKLVLEKNE